MKKAVLSVVVAGVVTAGYVGAVKYTGDQAHRMTLEMLADMERSPHYRNLFSFEIDSEKELLGGRYQVTLNVTDPDLQQAFIKMAGTSRISFDTTAQFGLFSADYRTVLAEGELLSRLKGVQKSARSEPLLSETQIRINPLDGAPDVTSRTHLEALHFAKDDKVFEMSASRSEATLKDRHYAVDAAIGTISLTEGGAERLTFDGMTLKQTAILEAGTSVLDGLFEAVDADIGIGALVGDDHKGTQVSIEPSQIRVKQSTVADRVQVSMAWDLGRTRVSDAVKGEVVNLRSAALDFTLDLDREAYGDLSRQMNNLQPTQLENPFLMMGLLSKVTEKGVKFGLNRFDIVMDDGQFKADGALDVKGFSLHQTMQNPQMVREQVTANVNLLLDETLAAKLPKARHREQLEQMVRQGFIIRSDNQLTTQLQIEGGRLVVNGVPMGNI